MMTSLSSPQSGQGLQPHTHGGLPGGATHVPRASCKAQKRIRPLPLLRGCTAGQAGPGTERDFISHLLGTGLGEDDPVSAQSHTHHKGVIGELVPVEEVLEEVGAFVAGVPPGHG